MGDSVTVANIPLNVQIAAVYENGLWPADPLAVARRFPATKYVTVWIDVNGSAAAHCQILDVEKGDATTAQAPGWIRARRAVVHTSLPTIYCNRSTYSGLVRTCAVGGLVAGRDYELWVSTLDGTRFTGQGVVACQYQGGATAKYDLSEVYYDKWHPLA